MYILNLTNKKYEKRMGKKQEKEKLAVGKNLVGFKLTNM